MPTKSDIVSFGGTTVASTNALSATIDATSATPTTDPAYQERQEAGAVYLSATRPPVDYTAIFKTDTYAKQAAVLAMLDFPRNERERTLVVYGGDFDAPTLVQADATVVDVTIDAGVITATFRVGSAVWQAVTPTIQGPTNFSASGSTAFTVSGECTTNPLIKVGWTAQRPSGTSTVGWKYRKRITVTNGSTQPLQNYSLQLGPWDALALNAAGKMLATMFDVAVFNPKGERLKTECVAKNSKASFVWFTVDELAAGDSITYDVCYGNAASNDANGFPYYKSYSPAIDITGTDGTVASYAAPVVTLSAAKDFDANDHVGSTFMVTAGAGIGQYRRVASHTTGPSSTLTFTRLLANAVDATSTYTLVRSGFVGDGGQSSAVSATSITDGSQAWAVNEWIGAIVETYNSGTGAIARTSVGTITANGPTSLTFSAWDGATPAVGDRYRVYRRNGRWMWMVAQTPRDGQRERGRWRLNRGKSKPSNMWFPVDGTPGAWAITTYNPGQASNDYNQRRVTPNGGEYYAALNASMARKDGANLPEEGFGNGVGFTMPLGLLGVRHDFQIKNPSGMCRAVFGCREQGGQDWELYKEYSTTQATLTSIAAAYYDLTQYGTPLHLLAALTSADDADIADDDTGTANLQDGTVLEAYIDTRLLTVTDIQTATEESIYDLSLTIRRGGATEAEGDDIIRIGGTDRHVFLPQNQQLWIGDDGILPLGARIYAPFVGGFVGIDNLSDANGTTLEAHVPSGGGTWTKHASSGAGSATIDTNRVHNTNTATAHLYYHSAIPADGASWLAADYNVECHVVMRSDNNVSFAGPAVRIDTVANTYYYARYNTNGNVWQLFKVVAGVETQIGVNVAQALVVDQAYVCTLAVRGSSLRLYVDYTLIIDQTDTAITAAGRGGLRMHDLATSTTGVHLDEYRLRQGDNQYQRDVPNGVRIQTVETDYTGTVQRTYTNDLLPLSPGSVTLRVSDEDGAIGTVDVAAIYSQSYL